MKKLFLLSILIASTFASLAQCDDYHLSLYCRPSPQEAKDMTLSSQSKSAYVIARQTYKFEFMLFRRMDYRIIFCSPEKFYPIHYVLKDRNTGVVLFDNQDDEYVESISISVIDESIAVEAEMTLLAKDTEFKDLRKDRACLGICIMYRKIPKLGF